LNKTKQAEVQKCRSAEVQKCRSAEVQKCRSAENLSTDLQIAIPFLQNLYFAQYFCYILKNFYKHSQTKSPVTSVPPVKHSATGG